MIAWALAGGAPGCGGDDGPAGSDPDGAGDRSEGGPSGSDDATASAPLDGGDADSASIGMGEDGTTGDVGPGDEMRRTEPPIDAEATDAGANSHDAAFDVADAGSIPV